jgi:hypothetical protein
MLIVQWSFIVTFPYMLTMYLGQILLQATWKPLTSVWNAAPELGVHVLSYQFQLIRGPDHTEALGCLL